MLSINLEQRSENREISLITKVQYINAYPYLQLSFILASCALRGLFSILQCGNVGWYVFVMLINPTIFETQRDFDNLALFVCHHFLGILVLL